ncbi:MAG: M48 family metalloprotease [Saprospiraceae bacterium]
MKTVLSLALAAIMIIGFTSSSQKEEDLGLIPEDSYKYKVAKEIFEELIAAKGDARLKVPEFIMSKKERYVAWMNGKKTQIGLEEKAYDICVSYGADSANAIAALLGHEITHYYEKHNWGSEFASAYTSMEISKEVKNKAGKEMKAVNETEADYLGGFLAHSAGYNTFGIMPSFLTDVYEAYGLGSVIPGYPSLDDRAKLAIEAEAKMQELVGIYQTANHLVVLQEFEEADKYFTFILKDFQSREIYNNAGVNAAMAALALVPEGEKESKYAYPLQLDGETRLDIKARGGVEAFGSAQRNKFFEMVDKAIKYFEQAKALDKKYSSAYLNLACAYDLKGEHEDAIYWARKAERLAKKSKNKKTQGDAKILKAIASFHLEEEDEGKELLQEVEQSFASSASLAALNNYIHQNNERPAAEAPKQKMSLKAEKIDAFSLSEFADNVDVDKQLNITPSIVYGHKKLENSKVTVNIVNGGEKATIFQMTSKNYTGSTALGLSIGASKADFMAKYGPASYTQETRTGQYLVYKNKKAIFYISNGRLASWTIYREIK